MSKQDLTEYSDNELSLIVMNDESLYRMRRQFLRDTDFLKELFIFTDDQLSELIQDIEEDLSE